MTDETPKTRIEFSPIFIKKLVAASAEIKQAFRETVELFEENPHHEGLHNHPLKDEYAEIRSINVTGDWRALYRRDTQRIIFVDLGTHDQLYG